MGVWLQRTGTCLRPLAALLSLCAVAISWMLAAYCLNVIALSITSVWAKFGPGMRAFLVMQVLVVPLPPISLYYLTRETLGLGRRTDQLAIVLAGLVLMTSAADFLFLEHRLFLPLFEALEDQPADSPAGSVIVALLCAGWILIFVR